MAGLVMTIALLPANGTFNYHPIPLDPLICPMPSLKRMSLTPILANCAQDELPPNLMMTTLNCGFLEPKRTLRCTPSILAFGQSLTHALHWLCRSLALVHQVSPR